MTQDLERYDAGLLNDHGGGNVSWWQDYIRAELERSDGHYQELHKANLSSSQSKVEELEREAAGLKALGSEALKQARKVCSLCRDNVLLCGPQGAYRHETTGDDACLAEGIYLVRDAVLASASPAALALLRVYEQLRAVCKSHGGKCGCARCAAISDFERLAGKP